MLYTKILGEKTDMKKAMLPTDKSQPKSRKQGTYPLNPLASDRAFGSTSPLLCALINQLPTYLFMNQNLKSINKMLHMGKISNTFKA